MSSSKNKVTLRYEIMFRKEDYGKLLNAKLSEILRRTTSKEDIANVSVRSNVSFSTIRDVIYRTNSLTRSNSKAIALLIYFASENAFAQKLRAESDLIFLDDILKL